MCDIWDKCWDKRGNCRATFIPNITHDRYQPYFILKSVQITHIFDQIYLPLKVFHVLNKKPKRGVLLLSESMETRILSLVLFAQLDSFRAARREEALVPSTYEMFFEIFF